MAAQGTRIAKDVVLIAKNERIGLNPGTVLILPEENQKTVGGILTMNPKGTRTGKIVGMGPKLPMQGTHDLGMLVKFNMTGATELEFNGYTYIVVPFSSILVYIKVPKAGRPKYDDPEKNSVMMLQNTDLYKERMKVYRAEEAAKKLKEQRFTKP